MPYYKISDFAKEVSIRIDNPQDSNIDRFVGLEHYDSGKPQVVRYGSTATLSSSAKTFEKGDVLVARRNVYLKRAGLVNFSGITSGDSIVLRPKNELAGNLLAFVLNCNSFWDYALKHSDGSMSKRLSPKMLLSYSFFLPESIDSKVRISKCLWAIEHAIDAYERLLKSADELIKSRFNEMFPEGKYSSRTLISCCADKDDVKCGPFGTQLSHDEYQTEGVPLYEIAQISSRFGKMPVNFLTADKAKKLSQYSLLPGDIAMSRKGKVGDCVVVPQHFDEGVIHSDVVRIRSNPRILLSEFLAYQFINSEKLQASANQVSSGAIMPGINVTKLKNVEVECPPIVIQKEFVERLHRIDKLKFNLQQAIDKAKKISAKILNNALSAEE